MSEYQSSSDSCHERGQDVKAAQGSHADLHEGRSGLSGTVASHYNNLQETGLKKRTESRIFYMRNFNNWIKSMAIGDALERLKRERGQDCRISVLDLCSGKGGDLLKWKKGGVSEVICADIAATSVEQCEVRYKELVERTRNERYSNGNLFTANQFIVADCTKERLKEKYSQGDTKFDLCSCQFSFHYSFESHHQADMMLRNACECLSVGGVFIGTTPNAYELVKRLHSSESGSFGSDVYRITFDPSYKQRELPLFGAKYDFHLEGVVDCPEFLVYFPALEKMAKKYGMELIYKKTFSDFFDEHIKNREGRNLIGRMQALEAFPPDHGTQLSGTQEEDYSTAKQKLREIVQDRSEGSRPSKLGTLSQAEWEATSLYLVFAFKKVK